MKAPLNAFLGHINLTNDMPSFGALSNNTVAVKDNICVQGVPCTCGSSMLKGWKPPYHANVIDRIVAAGGTIVGKTNMDEFGMGSSTENSAYGPTLNPHDTRFVPGGSSGGSAVAVAAGLSDLALGSDTGGSIRQPASFCGVVGLKPTYGLVSRYGLVAYASSLDQIGPIARTTKDVARLLSVIAGHDEKDSTSLRVKAIDYSQFVGREIRGLRIGIPAEMLASGVDNEVRSAIERVASQLERDGAQIKSVTIPALETCLSAYYLIASAEASSNLARYDGVRYGQRVNGASVEEMMTATRTQGFGSEVKRRIMLGTFVLSAGYQDQYYGQANRVRAKLIQAFEVAYEGVDLLLGPTSPIPPFRLGKFSGDPTAMYLTDVCTVPSNLAGHPAISVPAGMTAGGLPIGAQLMAPLLREDLLLTVASAIEARTGLDPNAFARSFRDELAA
jgi:aspartyl-tRNA(Asn)/glutamyl-tRNA(Gln) amidotransferase subunit A